MSEKIDKFLNKIVVGDCLEVLQKMPEKSVHCCVTSPPYWGLRDYGVKGQLGLEKTPEEYISKLVAIFRRVWRVLRDDGTLWLNMGDCYATGAGAVGNHPGGGERGARWRGDIDQLRDDKRGYRGARLANSRGKVARRKGSNRAQRGDGNNGTSFGPMTQPNRMPIAGLKTKDLCMMPARLAIALQADGWYLRRDIIWDKPNPMPESAKDRPTTSHEYIFLLAKAEKYFYDAEAVKEPVALSTIERGAVDFGGAKGRAAADDIKPGDPRYRGGPTGTQWGNTFDYEKSCTNGRNKRSVWNVATHSYPEAHFATFPPKLIEPCVRAGTSEKGVCSQCGAPRRRQVEKSRSFESGSGKSGRDPIGKNGPGLQGGGETKDIRRGPVVKSKTVGWEPSCFHISKTRPAVVLDPFMGAGTTALVAAQENRHFIGIDLNPEYAKIARKRIKNEVAQGKLL